MASIRVATTSDAEIVAKLLYNFYAELRGEQGWSPHSYKEYLESAREYLERDTIIIVYTDDKPAGFVRVSSREGSYWLEELYVEPWARGRGLARKLVEAAESFIRERDSFAYIMVLPQHRSALDFWLHMGYTILNSIELSKSLTGWRPAETRPFPFLSRILEVYRWNREEYSQLEREFLGVVEEFVAKGGSGEELLRLFSDAIREWLRGRSG